MKRVYLEEMFEYKGYKCACVFNAGGFRCGYVAVDENHPYYKKSYDLDKGPENIMCHWGLTYSGDGKHFYDGDDNLWWFGFDCGHCEDGVDYDTAMKYGLISEKEYAIGMNYQDLISFDGITVKDKEFVKENCKMIIEQLIAVKSKGE